MREIISAAEAARILHCRPQKVRERIKAGRWTFGKAVPPAKPGGQITYDIYARRMYQFFGMELPDSVHKGVRPEELQLPQGTGQ